MQVLKLRAHKAAVIDYEFERLREQWLVGRGIRIKVAGADHQVLWIRSFEDQQPTGLECPFGLVQQIDQLREADVLDEMKCGYRAQTVLRQAAQIRNRAGLDDLEIPAPPVFNHRAI